MIGVLIITNDGYDDVSYDVYVSYHINEVIAIMAIIEMMAMITYNIYANSDSLEVLFSSQNKIKKSRRPNLKPHKTIHKTKNGQEFSYAIAVKIFKDYSSNA